MYTCILAPGDPRGTSDTRSCKIIPVLCFKPLSVASLSQQQEEADTAPSFSGLPALLDLRTPVKGLRGRGASQMGSEHNV